MTELECACRAGRRGRSTGRRRRRLELEGGGMDARSQKGGRGVEQWAGAFSGLAYAGVPNPAARGGRCTEVGTWNLSLLPRYS